MLVLDVQGAQEVPLHQRDAHKRPLHHWHQLGQMDPNQPSVHRGCEPRNHEPGRHALDLDAKAATLHAGVRRGNPSKHASRKARDEWHGDIELPCRHVGRQRWKDHRCGGGAECCYDGHHFGQLRAKIHGEKR